MFSTHPRTHTPCFLQTPAPYTLYPRPLYPVPQDPAFPSSPREVFIPGILFSPSPCKRSLIHCQWFICFTWWFLTLSKRVLGTLPLLFAIISLRSVKFLLGQLDLLMLQRSFVASRCSSSLEMAILAYLVFLSRSLSCYRPVINYAIFWSISIGHGVPIFLSCMTTMPFSPFGCSAVSWVILFISCFTVHLHACFCMHAFFSFLQISNLVPYKSSHLGSNKANVLTWPDVSFSATGMVLQVYSTKTIQFHQRILEILLPLIPNSI